MTTLSSSRSSAPSTGLSKYLRNERRSGLSVLSWTLIIDWLPKEGEAVLWGTQGQCLPFRYLWSEWGEKRMHKIAYSPGQMKEPTSIVGVQRKDYPGGLRAKVGFKLGVKEKKVLINQRVSGENIRRRKQPKWICGVRNINTSLGTPVSRRFLPDIPSSTISCQSAAEVPKAACYSKAASLVTFWGFVNAILQVTSFINSPKLYSGYVIWIQWVCTEV